MVLTVDVGPARLTAIADASAATAVENLLAEVGATVGVGTAVDVDGAGHSAATAAPALAVADDRAPVVRWDDRFRSGVRAALSDQAAAVVSAQILGRLEEEPELLRTLRCYLERLGRWQPAAAELGIHRNTLAKRLRRICELTGRDVDTPAGRADLWIALEASSTATVRSPSDRRGRPTARGLPTGAR